MSYPRTPLRAAVGRRAPMAALSLTLAVAMSACTATASQQQRAQTDGPGAQQAADDVPAVTLSSNVPDNATHVRVDTVLELKAHRGVFRSVRVTGGDTVIPGTLSHDKATWTAGERLEPGTSYSVRTVTVDQQGNTRRRNRVFQSQDLTLDQQTYPSIAPLDGETVGVGMPVIISFDVAVTDRASVERHLSVESRPAQPGAWHWISDHEVHWRPREYWKPGTDVTVNADINSIPAGSGVYGQLSRTTSFSVGDSVIMNVDVAGHVMRVHKNGQLLRSIPISAGKPGFTTRSGVKVIIEKFRTKRMDAATTGISPDDPEYYNIANVEYAQRVTYSGEFLHAAPWSVGSQGSANVSHGCVGMSTANAAWLYGLTKRGDVVDVTGSDRHMTLTNGYGDWNLPFRDYKAGSALS